MAALPPSLKVEQSSSADRAENLKQQDSMYCRNHRAFFNGPEIMTEMLCTFALNALLISLFLKHLLWTISEGEVHCMLYI